MYYPYLEVPPKYLYVYLHIWCIQLHMDSQSRAVNSLAQWAVSRVPFPRWFVIRNSYPLETT